MLQNTGKDQLALPLSRRVRDRNRLRRKGLLTTQGKNSIPDGGKNTKFHLLKNVSHVREKQGAEVEGMCVSRSEHSQGLGLMRYHMQC